MSKKPTSFVIDNTLARINHYDALGYAEGWNLVARPQTDRNLMDIKSELEGALAYETKTGSWRTSNLITQRFIRAKVAGFNNAVSVLRGQPLVTEITIAEN